ncbi:MAG TPA: nuclear transport factor 2 family protein [Solimonas sp.]|nr:nuclear transport factor 2 family protein [Solimonas sp.]
MAPAPVTPLPSPAPTPDVAPPAPVPAYEAVVNDFHQAMAEGWKEGVLRHLADGVRIYEQGYAERSRDEYAAGHLDSDLVFAAATRRERLGRESGSSGDHAWVLSQSRTQGEIGGRTVDLEQTETMLLQRVGEAWQIVHIHWSAHGRGD